MTTAMSPLGFEWLISARKRSIFSLSARLRLGWIRYRASERGSTTARADDRPDCGSVAPETGASVVGIGSVLDPSAAAGRLCTGAALGQWPVAGCSDWPDDTANSRSSSRDSL